MMVVLDTLFTLGLSGSTVIGIQCEQEGAEHTALGSSGVEH